MGKKKNPIVIDREHLEKKGTKELLAYLNRLHRCEESFALSDMDVNPDHQDADTIFFKETEKWKTAFANVKWILNGRAHIEKKKPH